MTGCIHLYVSINASFSYLVSCSQQSGDPSVTLCQADMLPCSRDTGRCADSGGLGSAEVAVWK